MPSDTMAARPFPRSAILRGQLARPLTSKPPPSVCPRRRWQYQGSSARRAELKNAHWIVAPGVLSRFVRSILYTNLSHEFPSIAIGFGIVTSAGVDANESERDQLGRSTIKLNGTKDDDRGQAEEERRANPPKLLDKIVAALLFPDPEYHPHQVDQLWREAAEIAEELGIDPLSERVAALRHHWIRTLHALGLTSRAIEEAERHLRRYREFVAPKIDNVELVLDKPFANILYQMMQFQILRADLQMEPLPDEEAADRTSGVAAQKAVDLMAYRRSLGGGNGSPILLRREDLGELMGGRCQVSRFRLH